MIKYVGHSIRRLVGPKLTILLPLTVLATFVILLTNGAIAQEPSWPWGEPENLSLSANTSNPVIVVDSSGTAHVIWQDATFDYMYSSRKDGQWSQAIAVELPFATRRYYPELTERQRTPLHLPFLWADQDEGLHSLWMDEEQRLLYSNVAAAGIADFEAWTAPKELAASSLGAVAITDDAGGLHLVYVSPGTADLDPAGLFYRKSLDNGVTWSPPLLLYESPFFRSLTSGSANLQLVTQPDSTVVVAWDDPFQERVYMARSEDSGASWEPALEIDRRLEDDGAEAIGPNDIRIAATTSQIHAFWQAGHEGQLCSQYHQVSDNGGTSWLPAERLRSELETCPSSSILLTGDEDTVVFVALTELGGHLSAWDGARWGETQGFSELSHFLNPLNYREVVLACNQAVTGVAGAGGDTETRSAIVIGCDTGVGGDIWAQSVELDQLIASLVPQATPIWQTPDLVSESTGSDSLQLLADTDGRLHALWLQPVLEDGSQRSVHYSRWDGNGWSQAKDILSFQNGPAAIQPIFALNPDDKIMAVWVDAAPGNVYFSQADLAKASNSAEWSSPIMLPMPEAQAVSPSIDLDLDGIIYVAYAVTINENRGIYLTQSGDGGETWLGPVQVFNGAEAAWSMVDSPRLAIGGDGTLHLMWTRYSSPPDAQPVSIYYARSTDGGVSWSDAAEIVQAPAKWKDLLATGELVVHRFWMADNQDLWHQVSIDGGISWEQPQRVSSYVEALASVDALLDGAGRPWLFQAVGTRTEDGKVRQPVELRSWVLSEGRWTTSEALDIGDVELKEFAAAATSGGDMNVIFIAEGIGSGEDEQGQAITHSRRSLDLPEVQPTALPTLTPTPLPQATGTSTPAPLPTATTSFPTQRGQNDGFPIPIDTSNPLTGPVLGIIPAAFIVLIAFFVGVRFLRGDRRR